MGEPRGSEIDFNVIVLDDTVDGIYGPAQNVDVIPREARASIGYISGREVRCLSAEYQIRSHFGYQLKAKDIADVAALRYRFGIDVFCRRFWWLWNHANLRFDWWSGWRDARCTEYYYC
ncbi:MAG: hypothetical protein LC739_03235 [Actinobacteria bacterium]|nr:hypothetical protein [Actinomycetota bacterium]